MTFDCCRSYRSLNVWSPSGHDTTSGHLFGLSALDAVTHFTALSLSFVLSLSFSPVCLPLCLRPLWPLLASSVQQFSQLQRQLKQLKQQRQQQPLLSTSAGEDKCKQLIRSEWKASE